MCQQTIKGLLDDMVVDKVTEYINKAKLNVDYRDFTTMVTYYMKHYDELNKKLEEVK